MTARILFVIAIALTPFVAMAGLWTYTKLLHDFLWWWSGNKQVGELGAGFAFIVLTWVGITSLIIYFGKVTSLVVRIWKLLNPHPTRETA